MFKSIMNFIRRLMAPKPGRCPKALDYNWSTQDGDGVRKHEATNTGSDPVAEMQAAVKPPKDEGEPRLVPDVKHVRKVKPAADAVTDVEPVTKKKPAKKTTAKKTAAKKSAAKKTAAKTTTKKTSKKTTLPKTRPTAQKRRPPLQRKRRRKRRLPRR